MVLNTLRTELYQKSCCVVKVDEKFEVVRPRPPWHANQPLVTKRTTRDILVRVNIVMLSVLPYKKNFRAAAVTIPLRNRTKPISF